MTQNIVMGKKIGMTQVFDEKGKIIPVTVVEANPSVIVQVKNSETDGYEAIQLGYGSLKASQLTKPLKGHFAKANVSPARYLKEFRVDSSAEYKEGQEFTLEQFTEGQIIDVTGISKGKGFCSTIKRWNFHRGPMSHGSKNHRRPASAGAKGPARVFKGKKSPGRHGGKQVTVQNLEIVKLIPDNNLILIKGAIPGAKKSLIIVRNAVKA